MCVYKIMEEHSTTYYFQLFWWDPSGSISVRVGMFKCVVVVVVVGAAGAMDVVGNIFEDFREMSNKTPAVF